MNRPDVNPWGDSRPLNSHSAHLTRIFGGRVQKVAVNAGFTCPNRDGTLAAGGCTFCDNAAFTPSYCTPDKSIARQIDEGIEFHLRRYRRAVRYLAYFQPYSNTYAPVERLREVFSEALAHPQVCGITVSTRPDCIDPDKLELLSELSRRAYVAVEYGIESVYDRTLAAVRRGHDFACARRAVEDTAAAGLPVGAHFILGLPDETDEDILASAGTINRLPLTSVKFHQLQIFRGTAMEADRRNRPEAYRFPALEDYLDLVTELLRRLRPSLAVERIASETPPRFNAGPSWEGVRNETVRQMLESRMLRLGVRQGDLWRP